MGGDLVVSWCGGDTVSRCHGVTVWWCRGGVVVWGCQVAFEVEMVI